MSDIIEGKVFQISGISIVTSRRESYQSMGINLVLELNEMAFSVNDPRYPDKGKYVVSSTDMPSQIILRHVDNHTLQAFIQWFSKSPSGRILIQQDI